jgi:competence protein ComEA
VSCAPEARRHRARFVLGCIGLLLLAAVLSRVYTQSVASRYAPAASAATVDVNGDDAAALERLPGIGPTLARRIVAEREARGPFRGFADLSARVEGIGPKVEAALEGLVRFGG